MGKVKLGKTYRDKVHGFEGIAAARSEHLNGCVRVGIESLKDGEIKEHWFDEVQLELVKGKKKAPTKKGSTGGPRTAPPSRNSRG